MPALTHIEMFDELVRRGYVVPANIDPASWMMPTAYLNVPTTTAFVTPPIAKLQQLEDINAKLGTRSKRDSRRKRQPKR